MSKLLTALVTEHDHILRVLAALHDYAAFHAHDDGDVRAVLGQFVTYLREYVDGWHHHKEEEVLFVAMGHAGLPMDGGPLGCMLREHDAGRRHVGMLAELAAARVPGPLTQEELAVMAGAVAGYVALLTSHIAKENQVLYPMAERIIAPGALAALDELGERASGDPGDGRRLEDLGDELIARFTAARIAS